MKSNNFSVVFYDGECGFCNHAVQTILTHRKHDEFQFTTLQSELAKELLKPFDIQISMETIYIVQNDKVYQKSNAILRLVNELKGTYKLLKIGYILPRFIRDGIYNIISQNRHKLNAEYCVLPTEVEKKMFIND